MLVQMFLKHFPYTFVLLKCFLNFFPWNFALNIFPSNVSLNIFLKFFHKHFAKNLVDNHEHIDEHNERDDDEKWGTPNWMDRIDPILG